jgi:branched-chain amino acid transport system ATP-binding protein
VSALLEVRGLCAGYGHVRVLHEIDLAIEPGSITAVLGANGAGKTTLLRSLSGLLHPSAGSISFQGTDLADVPVERLVTMGVAHVPEGRGVITELTVDENLRLGGLWRRGANAAKDTAAAVAQVYDLFGSLAERRNFHGHQLSGGERQMLALGRALVAKPSLLLLDEPSLGLAPAVTARIMALLLRLRDEMGLTVLLVEQNVRSALAIADRGVVVSLGRVVAEGPAVELQADDNLRRTYLGF